MKIFLLFISLLFINCGGQSYPEEQELFLDKINSISDKYMDVTDENSYARNLTIKEMRSFLKQYENVPINNWMGNIKEVYPGMIEVETKDGTLFTLYTQKVDDTSDLKMLDEVIDSNILINLKEGTLISFSGTLDYESSLTTSGMMSDPEFRVTFNKLIIP